MEKSENLKELKKDKQIKEEFKTKNKDIINKIYQAQEEKIDEIIKKSNEEIKEKIKPIKAEEIIRKNIEKIIEKSNNQKEIQEILDKKLNQILNQIEENYNIKISKYNEEMYKKGFIDGVNLIINCLTDKENK